MDNPPPAKIDEWAAYRPIAECLYQSSMKGDLYHGNCRKCFEEVYRLSALAVQTMTVDLSFTEGQAILAGLGADGKVLAQ